MATGFKQATVNASDVPATQTDFPAYVALDRLGITTLAEAQSVRVYADEAKTTEWAREIVSATEMHVKIPSLTSTTDIYVDYDGVRADYAVTDTYGRNAVWSDYAAVWHFQSDATDSTGNYSAGTVTGATNSAQKIGNGYSFDGTNDKIALGRITQTENVSALTHQMWHSSNLTTDRMLWGTPDIGSGNGWEAYYEEASVKVYFCVKSVANRFNWPVTNMVSGTRYLWHVVFDGAGSGNTGRLKLYQNATDTSGTGTYTGTIEATTQTSTGNLTLGERPGGTFDLNGTFDEMRIRQSALSANWITSEYANQNTESTFWGTWTDAGGAPAANSDFFNFL
jgi:hypothetical protein